MFFCFFFVTSFLRDFGVPDELMLCHRYGHPAVYTVGVLQEGSPALNLVVFV